MDKNEAIKKIKFQVSKRNKKHITPERKQQMVQGIIDANIDPEFVIKSEMPEEMMGVKIDWDNNKATDIVIESAVKIVKPIIKIEEVIEEEVIEEEVIEEEVIEEEVIEEEVKDCDCDEDCDCGEDCECYED